MVLYISRTANGIVILGVEIMAIAYEIQKAGQAALDQIHSTFSALSDLKNSSDQLLANKTVYSNTYSTGNYIVFTQDLYSNDFMTYTIASDYPEMITIKCSGTTAGTFSYSLQGYRAEWPRDDINASTYFEIYKPYQVSAVLGFRGPNYLTISRERLYE